MIIEILTAALAIMFMSFSGKLFVWKSVGNFVQYNLRYMVTLSTGVFATTLFLMLDETANTDANILTVSITAVLGALTLELLQRLIPESHHHHGSNEEECCEHMATHKINPRRVLLGDAIHNIADGILLVSAFVIDVRVGIAATVGIMLHEFIQETSQFFILKRVGYSDNKALLQNFFASTSILLGVGVSLLLVNVNDFVPLLIAFAAGSFIYIILRDLLPHTISNIKHQGGSLKHLASFVLGVLIMSAAALLL